MLFGFPVCVQRRRSGRGGVRASGYMSHRVAAVDLMVRASSGRVGRPPGRARGLERPPGPTVSLVLAGPGSSPGAGHDVEGWG